MTFPDTMQAVRLHPPGGVDGIRVERLPTPEPGSGEALVRVHAAAITRDELTWPAGRLPAIPSYEVSGTLVISPEGSDELVPGSDVFGMTDFDRDGVAAEFAVIPTVELVAKPASRSHVESAAIPLAALSAYQGLVDHGGISRNQRVLIHGGAGGVGALAVQIARLRGAHVIATASGPRVEVAGRLGADEVIDHTETDFTVVDPVDLVFDTVGGDRLARSAQVLKEGGRLVSVAGEPPVQESSERDIEAKWFLVRSDRGELAEIARYVDEGLLMGRVEQVYPLADAVTAFGHLEENTGGGKIVLAVGSETEAAARD